MRWVDWDGKQLKKVQDINWLLASGEELLRLMKSGNVALGNESYLYSRRPDRFDRIISMCSWIEFPGDVAVVGTKWVSSNTGNRDMGLPRGAAITILNDAKTGLPMLAFSGSNISMARTAMVSCLAMKYLFDSDGPSSMGLVGAGMVHAWQAVLAKKLWPDLTILVYDLDKERAYEFAEQNACRVVQDWRDCLHCDVFSLATSGIRSVCWLPATLELHPLMAKVWLNTSLRDMQFGLVEKFPLVVVDDHELAISESTSYGLACQSGIFTGKEISLIDLVVDGFKLQPDFHCPVLVTPMGLATWDVGIGYRLFEEEFKAELGKLNGVAVGKS
jgi:ornithine cyclodeaminase/alanine dehydrogenase-like protein (mu-crystallin family)